MGIECGCTNVKAEIKVIEITLSLGYFYIVNRLQNICIAVLGNVCRTPFCMYMGLTERGCMHMHSFCFVDGFSFVSEIPYYTQLSGEAVLLQQDNLHISHASWESLSLW